MKTWSRWAILVLGLTGCTRTPPEARADELGAPEALQLEPAGTAPVGLGYLSGVRVASDGTVLMADPLAPAVVRVNMDAGAVDTLGRDGDGPEEYRQPDEVFPLAGDSSLVVDLGRMRLTYLDASGAFVGGIAMMVPSGREFPIIMHPRGTDRTGGIYYRATRTNGGPRDSAAIVRFDRATHRHDTVASVWTGTLEVRGSGENRKAVQRLLVSADDWAVGLDGSVAVIRADEYRVEWYRPDGTVVAGAPHPVERYPVRRADQEAELVSVVETGVSSFFLVGGSAGFQVRMRRGLQPGPEGPSVERYEWSETLPVFVYNSPRVAPTGELWVERRVPAGQEGFLDVFDGTGTHVDEVPLPANRQLVGFSPDGALAFLARRDDYGLRWLERYRIVRSHGPDARRR